MLFLTKDTHCCLESRGLTITPLGNKYTALILSDKV
jgi:hypothetical protein